MKVRQLRRLLAQARPYRGRLSLAIAAAIGVSLLSPIVPMITRTIIDRAIGGRDARLLFWLLGSLAVSGLVKAFLFGARRQLAGEVSVAVEADLRSELYEHVQALDTGYHERVSTGQVMSRASSDLQAVRQIFMMFPWGITLLLLVVVVAVLLFVLDPPLAGMALSMVPLMAIATGRFVTRFDPVVWRMQQRLADLATVVEETVTGIRVVKAFGREELQVRKLSVEAEGVYEEAVRSIRLRASFAGATNLLPQLGLATVIFLGGHRVLSEQITVGTLVAFNAYLLMLVWPIRALGMIAANAQRAATAGGRIFDVLDTVPGIADRPGAEPLEVREGTVSFGDVWFAYPESGPTLNGVNLEVRGGTSIALVGSTGCGKSTLMRLVPRFIEPARGSVKIDGTDIATVTLRSLRASIGIVFEDTFLFSDTIRANIAFGRPDASLDEVVRAAVIAQAHEFIEELPGGYDAVVGEQGYTLSGGQRQRIAIARAVLMDPKVLILDDATSSVDARVEAAIRRGLVKAMEGRTTLIVARRPSTAALADRVAYMEAGLIVATGTHDELWRDVPGYREAMAAPSVEELAS